MQAASASSSAMPSSAAMVPGASSPARAMASPRATTRWIPSSNPRAPLATRAVYSPRLCPAQAAGVRPIRSTASRTTRLKTVVASCAFSVLVSSSIGAASNSWDRSRPAAAEASSTTSQEGWSTHGSPMPARCEPCPGKVKTNTNATAPIVGGQKNPQCGMWALRGSHEGAEIVPLVRRRRPPCSLWLVTGGKLGAMRGTTMGAFGRAVVSFGGCWHEIPDAWFHPGPAATAFLDFNRRWVRDSLGSAPGATARSPQAALRDR